MGRGMQQINHLNNIPLAEVPGFARVNKKISIPFIKNLLNIPIILPES